MTTPTTASPLRQRMIEDMIARRLVPGTQVGHIRACKRFAAWLKRSPETATADDLRGFQMHLTETGVSAITRNRTMTGLRFLFRVTLRRLDLLPEMYFIKEPQKVPLILSQDEARRLLAMSDNVRNRLLLSIGYGAGLRAGEVVRLKVKHIDRDQMIIRVEQSKGQKDRLVMLSPETLALLDEWWPLRTNKYDLGVPVQERWLFPGRRGGQPMTPETIERRLRQNRIPALHGRTAALRQLVLQAPAPVVARMLGYSLDHTARVVTEAGATWARYAPEDHSR